MIKKSVCKEIERKNYSLIVLFFFFIITHSNINAQTDSIQVGEINRKLIVYAPQNIPDNRPLLISMHGAGQGADYQQGQAKYESIADTAKFVVVYPAGINKRWDISGTSDIEFIEAIIDEMYRLYKVDRSRIYLSGFSMGGMMTYYAATKIADKIAAFAPVGGYLMRGPNTASTRPVPIIHVHGTDDDVVPYDGSIVSVKAWAERNNCSMKEQITSPYPSGKNGSCATMNYWGLGDDGVEVVLLTLKGKGHWHSTDANCVNSSEEIWNFVKKYSLNTIIK